MSTNYTSSKLKKTKFSCFHAFGFIFLLTLIFTFHTTTIYSAQVTLTWDPNSESDLAGYKIYNGNSSGNYDTNIDVGNQTSYTISGLVDGNAYYFVATAYDFSGNESDYSAEVFYSVSLVNNPPVLDLISDISVNEGDTVTFNPTATDPDGDTLTYTYSGWMTSASYTTGYNDVGTHTVTVTVSDGSLTDSKDVTIIVNDVDVISPSPPDGFRIGQS